MVFGITNAIQQSTLALFLLTQQHDVSHDNQLCRTSQIQQHVQERLESSQSTTTTTSLFMTSSLISEPVEKSKYIQLLEWLQQPQPQAQSDDEEENIETAYINEKLIINESTGGDGYGMFVTQDCTEDELLFTIPRNLCFTLNDALEDVDCGTQFKSLIDKAGPGGNTVAMAGYMAKEYLVGKEQEKSDNNNSSRWGPYFATLPWKRGINNQEHILFWDDEKIESLLDGSLCYSEATSLREEVDLAIRVLGPMTRKPIQIARGIEQEEDGFKFPWQVNNDDSKKNEKMEGFDDAVKGAFVCLLTRAFQDGDGDEEKLVPLLDMLNHAETPNVRHAMRKSDGTVEVRARCDIPAGSELWNQYRSEEEESMPYSRFFTRFGFVPGISEPMENLLRDKSSIFYPQVAEV